MNVRESLCIIWHGSEGGEEVTGIAIYAQFAAPGSDALTALEKFWNAEEVCLRASSFAFEGGSIKVADIRVDSWPTPKKWLEAIKSSLKFCLDAGTSVAWAGDESCSWHPDVLDPTKNAGNVYAAYSRQTGFLCNAGLDDEIAYLNDEQLKSLNRF